MAIKYSLVPNTLTEAKDSFRAVIQGQSSKTLEDVINRMIERGSTITRADAMAVIEEYHNAVGSMMREGFTVHTPLFRSTVSIKGVFDGRKDGFSADRHTISLNLTPGPLINTAANTLQATKVSPQASLPELYEYEDVVSAAINTTITPGGVGKLTGSKLKVDPTDPETGIYLVAEDSATTKVTSLVEVRPSSLIFVVPMGLTEGVYQLEVRTRPRINGDIRTGILAARLEYQMQ